MNSKQMRIVVSCITLMVLAVRASAETPSTQPIPVTIYVDNVNGSDNFDGSRAAPADGNAGPVASLARAEELLAQSGRLVLAKTGKPYRGEIRLITLGGTPEHPLVIEANGAIVEGIEPTKPVDWTDEGNGIISTKWEPHLGFFVVVDGEPPRWGKSRAELEPGESFGDYEAHRGYFRLPAGKSARDCVLEIPARYNGVMIYDSNNVIIRNLHARYFLNDGFNFGGRSENLRFENVEGAYNGDEGFSAHDDAQASVTDSRFHHNDNGIADTVYSRTTFQRVSVHDNRTMGIWFLGGDHALVDVAMWANPTGVVIEPIYPLPLPGHARHPYLQSRVMMRNVFVRDGDSGLRVSGGSSAAVDYCTFVGQPVGIILADKDSSVHMINSVVQTTEGLRNAGQYFGDHNAWSTSTPTITPVTTTTTSPIDGVAVPLADWFKQNQIEEHSVVSSIPLVDPADPSRLLPGSAAAGRAFVYPEYQAWLRHALQLPDDHPPTQSVDPGARTQGGQGPVRDSRRAD